jgi:two-component system, cell cycle response regulator
MGQESRTKVLVVEDSPVYRRLITGHLEEWGFRVSIAKNGMEAWNILQEPDTPKLVLMDWIMPGMDGVDLCRKLRSRSSSDSYVYIILLTAKDAKGDLLQAMEAGADDYLAKPFDELELRARLLVGSRILQLHEELIAARETMRYAATHDALTGLTSRGEVLEMLRREMVRCKREHKPVAVALADIDFFKDVNDEMGHLFGDSVLKEAAKRLRESLRAYDGVGRYGGEEFLIVLPGCPMDPATVRANQIRESVSGTPISASGKKRTVTVSMGIAVWDGSMDMDTEQLINRADVALYQAKRNGRNRVEQAAAAPA